MESLGKVSGGLTGSWQGSGVSKGRSWGDLGSLGQVLESYWRDFGRLLEVLGVSEGQYRAAKVLHVDSEAITIGCS